MTNCHMKLDQYPSVRLVLKIFVIATLLSYTFGCRYFGDHHIENQAETMVRVGKKVPLHLFPSYIMSLKMNSPESSQQGKPSKCSGIRISRYQILTTASCLLLPTSDGEWIEKGIIEIKYFFKAYSTYSLYHWDICELSPRDIDAIDYHPLLSQNSLLPVQNDLAIITVLRVCGGPAQMLQSAPLPGSYASRVQPGESYNLYSFSDLVEWRQSLSDDLFYSAEGIVNSNYLQQAKYDLSESLKRLKAENKHDPAKINEAYQKKHHKLEQLSSLSSDSSNTKFFFSLKAVATACLSSRGSPVIKTLPDGQKVVVGLAQNVLPKFEVVSPTLSGVIGAIVGASIFCFEDIIVTNLQSYTEWINTTIQKRSVEKI
ncbi:MAG: hypothetical protein OXC40_06765 [Proteobacteria bacterium]|nr:hypothetical protein [Pseudomonadota bacterium]